MGARADTTDHAISPFLRRLAPGWQRTASPHAVCGRDNVTSLMDWSAWTPPATEGRPTPLAERLDQGSSIRGQVWRSAGGDQVAVDHHRLVHVVGPGVHHVVLDPRGAGHRSALEDACRGRHPAAVADHPEELA